LYASTKFAISISLGRAGPRRRRRIGRPALRGPASEPTTNADHPDRRHAGDFSAKPWRVDGDRACRLVEQYAKGERLMAAGKALALRQVAATCSWKRAGAFRDVSSWLASVAGTTVGQATATVVASERVASLPRTEAA
jgi:hypothetical protein